MATEKFSTPLPRLAGHPFAFAHHDDFNSSILATSSFIDVRGHRPATSPLLDTHTAVGNFLLLSRNLVVRLWSITVMTMYLDTLDYGE